MSKKTNLLNNIGLKLLSLVIAVIFWLLVMNISDYSVTKSISGINVQVINGDSIENLGKVYDITSGKTVTVVVKGPKSIVDKLKPEDFKAVADLSKLSLTNSVEIVVSAVSDDANDRLEINVADNILKLTIEDKVSKQFPIKIVTAGNVADSYSLGNCQANPNIVTIEGPESVIKKINEVRSVVDVTNRSESFESTVELSCFDVYGADLSGENITFGTKTVNVKIPVYETKEVDVQISTTGQPANGYEINGINYNPITVRVAGEKDKLDSLKVIKLDDISIEGITATTEINVDIKNYLPEGIYLADENDQIAISVEIEGTVERKITVNSSDISFTGMNKDRYEYDIKFPANYSVTLSGLNDNIKDIKVKDLEPKVDVTNKTEGEYQIYVTYKSHDDFAIKNEQRVTLIIKDKTTENSSEDEGQ